MKKTLIAAAVIFAALMLAIDFGYKNRYAASIGIIGGADGPTVIFVAGKLGLFFYAGVALLAAAAVAVIVHVIRRRRR